MKDMGELLKQNLLSDCVPDDFGKGKGDTDYET